MTTSPKRRELPYICSLPDGQRRAAAAFIGGKFARTYIEAAAIAGISVKTLYSHLRRVRLNRPSIYRKIMTRRKQQLEVRHANAAENARYHSRLYFRNMRKHNAYIYRLMFGLHRS